MKRNQATSLSCLTLLLVLAACGVDATDAEKAATSDSQVAAVSHFATTTSATNSTAAQELETTEASGGTGGATDPTAFGKRCNASCSVVSVGAASCPTNIGGFGSTSFLGGCNKACRKAEGDAASKLPAGCVINNCSFSGC
jgi:hypothetical protein